MSEIKDLQPQAIWKNFYLLTQVPRPSGTFGKNTEISPRLGCRERHRGPQG